MEVTMNALKRIERNGLYVIQDGHLFAVSIDANGAEPTDEQRRECDWFETPELAAEQYIRDNADLF
jgi:hypothetical protein